jgi:D-glycero-D-manno-heptose 1,7-bisphosphate phosphatase
MKKAVFLDRDGVINKLILRGGKAQAPYNLEEFELFPGVVEAFKIIRDSGFLTVIVTNQPDVARGWVAKENVELVNNKIREVLPVDDLRVCYHTNENKCGCRKPMPGMLFEAALELSIDLKKSFMIGDRFSDISAGHTAGCKTVLIGNGDEQLLHPDPDYKAEFLLEAIQLIL